MGYSSFSFSNLSCNSNFQSAPTIKQELPEAMVIHPSEEDGERESMDEGSEGEEEVDTKGDDSEEPELDSSATDTLHKKQCGYPNCINVEDYKISFRVAWERTIISKQTLFPMWQQSSTSSVPEKKDSGKSGKSKAEMRRKRGKNLQTTTQAIPWKGVPFEGKMYSIRVTKSVNMQPYPILTILKADGTLYDFEEEVRLELVDSTTLATPPKGNCPCEGTPVLRESKFTQLHHKNGGIYCNVSKGVLELSKLQIGCCTGKRGHNVQFRLMVEFTGKDSPFRGNKLYSVPIEVGAKSPFTPDSAAKGKSSKEKTNKISSSAKRMKRSDPLTNYCDPVLFELLKNLNIDKYSPIFFQNRIDKDSFPQLTDRSLVEMGITAVGPRVKIMREVKRMTEELQRQKIQKGERSFLQRSPEKHSTRPPTVQSLSFQLPDEKIGALVQPRLWPEASSFSHPLTCQGCTDNANMNLYNTLFPPYGLSSLPDQLNSLTSQIHRHSGQMNVPVDFGQAKEAAHLSAHYPPENLFYVEGIPKLEEYPLLSNCHADPSFPLMETMATPSINLEVLSDIQDFPTTTGICMNEEFLVAANDSDSLFRYHAPTDTIHSSLSCFEQQKRPRIDSVL